MEKVAKEKSTYRWKIPLLAAIICLAWEVAIADQIDINLKEILFVKGFIAFIGLSLIYNWSMDKRKDKPTKMELVLVLPMFFMIIFGVVPPFTYVRQWLITVGLLIMGVEFAAFGLGYWLQETRLKRICTGRSIAMVMDNVQDRTDTRPGEASTKTYFPVLSYNANGKQVEMQYEHGQLRPMEVGKRVEICYNPQKIEEFCFLEQKENTALTFGVTFILIFSVCALVACVLSIVFQWSV